MYYFFFLLFLSYYYSYYSYLYFKLQILHFFPNFLFHPTVAEVSKWQCGAWLPAGFSHNNNVYQVFINLNSQQFLLIFPHAYQAFRNVFIQMNNRSYFGSVLCTQATFSLWVVKQLKATCVISSCASSLSCSQVRSVWPRQFVIIDLVKMLRNP